MDMRKTVCRNPFGAVVGNPWAVTLYLKNTEVCTDVLRAAGCGKHGGAGNNKFWIEDFLQGQGIQDEGPGRGCP